MCRQHFIPMYHSVTHAGCFTKNVYQLISIQRFHFLILQSLGREVPASPVTPVPQTTSFTKPTGLVSTAAGMAQAISLTKPDGLVFTAERMAQTTSITKPVGLVSMAGRMAQTTSVTNPAGPVSNAARMAQIASVTKPVGLVSNVRGMAQTTSVTKPVGPVSNAERMAQITSVPKPVGLVSSAGGMAQTTSVTQPAGLVSSAGGMAQTTSVTKPTGPVSPASGMPSSGPSITPRPTSLATIVISGSDPGLTQKSTVQRYSVQVASNANSHSQRKSTEPLTSTAVVYTVKPRLAELTVQHDANEKQNFFQASSSDVIVSKATYLQTRNGRSLETPVSKTFHQPRPLEPRSAASDLPLKTISLSQTDSRLEMIRQKQQTLLQQRELLRQQEQQQQRLPGTSVSPAQHSTETTASLLQQLQRQQQLQQQQHYHRVVHQEQKSQVRHLSTPPGQESQPEQYRRQLETPISSISAMVQQQKPQSKAVESSSILLQEKQQLIRSPILSTPQQSNHSSSDQETQGSIYSFVQKQSQPSTASNLPTSSITFNATHLDNVLNRVERPLMSSAGKSQIPVVPSGQVQESQSTFLKQTSVSNQRSNLLNSNTIVQDHINKIVNHPYSGRLGSLGKATATEMKDIPSTGGQHSATLQRHESALRRSSFSQDVATVQFRKSFPRETFSPRTALATNQRDNSRPPPERLQQRANVQNPNSQMHPQHDHTGRQPQTSLNNTHSTFVIAGENASNVKDSQLSKEASSTLSTVVASTYRRLEPKLQDKQQSILVPARKKHTNEELLPSGYRFSLPSPEYLLQRQKLQQQSTSQSFQNISSTERVTVPSEHTSEQSRMVYTMQSPEKGMVTTPSQRRFQNARNALPPSGHRPSLENWPPKSKQQELQVQQIRQTPQLQSRSNQVQRPLQGQQQVNAAPVTNESGNHLINLQSLYRKPIQSPGISSSDPRSEKHSLDTERTSSSTATASNISNDKRDARKPLPKPSASIAVMDRGIVLSWNMEHDDAVIKIDNYELFACQDVTENKEQPIKWKKIGIVKALPLPMACTLTQFSSGSKYFFSVRAVDEQERAGPFSDPCTVALTPS